jgi:hypothetical protein
MPSVHQIFSIAALASLTPSVFAQDPVVTQAIYRNQDECHLAGDSFLLEWFQEPECRRATFSLDWEEDVNGYYSGFMTTDNLDDDCMVLFGEPNDASPETCGTVYQTFSTQRSCVPTNFRSPLNYIYCCGDDCDDYVPTVASNATKRAEKKPAPRDVTAIKRTNPLATKRQSECTFNPDEDETRMSFGDAQRVVSDLNCNSGTEQCTIESTVSLSVSHTTGFDVTSELSASLFEVVQASISFSYYTEDTSERTYETSYTATLEPGTSGYLTFTPDLECESTAATPSVNGASTNYV